jgi:allantoate deiminase
VPDRRTRHTFSAGRAGPRGLSSGAARVLERCDRLAQVSEEPGRLTRRFGTPAMKEANALVAGWMREAGLETREDVVGNLIGRRGDGVAGKIYMLGSHLDTVVDAGRYDGPLGVLVALEAVQRVERDVEIVGFADEEGVRFGTAYLGSSAMTGRFDPAWLDRTDGDVRLGDLVGDPGPAREDIEGYVEVHIEQGPVLERLGEPVGVVTAIQGQSHAEVTFVGEAGHAGTVPHDARRDALTAAAEWILAVERAGGTVGRVQVEPNVRNVIPGNVTVTLDLRHPDDATRRATFDALRLQAGRDRDVEVVWRDGGDSPAVAMDERLSAAFGVDVRLPSGAGHDAAMMASIAPAAMLFVRCAGGISHNPAEAVEEADVAVALEALERLLRAV